MREIVEQGSEEGCDDENLDDVGAACHRYNSNLCNCKYRTWRPPRTNQVAMSASNNRRAIRIDSVNLKHGLGKSGMTATLWHFYAAN